MTWMSSHDTLPVAMSWRRSTRGCVPDRPFAPSDYTVTALVYAAMSCVASSITLFRANLAAAHQMMHQVEDLRRQFEQRETEAKKAFLQDLQAVTARAPADVDRITSAQLDTAAAPVISHGCSCGLRVCRPESRQRLEPWPTPKRCTTNSFGRLKRRSSRARTRWARMVSTDAPAGSVTELRLCVSWWR